MRWVGLAAGFVVLVVFFVGVGVGASGNLLENPGFEDVKCGGLFCTARGWEGNRYNPVVTDEYHHSGSWALKLWADWLEGKGWAAQWIDGNPSEFEASVWFYMVSPPPEPPGGVHAKLSLRLEGGPYAVLVEVVFSYDGTAYAGFLDGRYRQSIPFPGYEQWFRVSVAVVWDYYTGLYAYKVYVNGAHVATAYSEEPPELFWYRIYYQGYDWNTEPLIADDASLVDLSTEPNFIQ